MKKIILLAASYVMLIMCGNSANAQGTYILSYGYNYPVVYSYVYNPQPLYYTNSYYMSFNGHYWCENVRVPAPIMYNPHYFQYYSHYYYFGR